MTVTQVDRKCNSHGLNQKIPKDYDRICSLLLCQIHLATAAKENVKFVTFHSTFCCSLFKRNVRVNLPRKMNEKRHVVVEIRKSNSILCTHWLPNDDFIDVIELVPIIIAQVVILDERFEFRSTRNRHVKSLCCEEAFRIE